VRYRHGGVRRGIRGMRWIRKDRAGCEEACQQTHPRAAREPPMPEEKASHEGLIRTIAMILVEVGMIGLELWYRPGAQWHARSPKVLARLMRMRRRGPPTRRAQKRRTGTSARYQPPCPSRPPSAANSSQLAAEYCAPRPYV